MPPAIEQLEGLSQWYERLHDVMPWGSSTCSKAARLMPEEPVVIERGRGCRVWDDQGREFIDFRNALGPISLGYCYEPVDRAIKEQLAKGIVFGHPHPLECEVAEMLCDVIPCAEQARFLKTGGEAVAATIKAARHYTGRDHIIQCGYHGWVNSLGRLGRQLPSQYNSDTPAGIPATISALHHNLPWCDIAHAHKLFDELDGQVAALVVAAEYLDMEKGAAFYPQLRKLCDEHGTVLIFDEIVTGFRMSLGGIQEYFDVTPDMAVFAKGIANGMPLSAYVGKRDLMQAINKAVVSTTYGGEALSLAAAKATIQTYLDHDVISHIHETGKRLRAGINSLLQKHEIAATLAGTEPIPYWDFSQAADVSLTDDVMRACFREGISLYSALYVNFSHQPDDVVEALARFGRAFASVHPD